MKCDTEEVRDDAVYIGPEVDPGLREQLLTILRRHGACGGPAAVLCMADPINYPAHYTFGAVEVIDAIEAWGLNFARGAVVKYVARAGRKDPAKEIEDLRKAKWYIEREINRLEKERE